jgi:hypothetical protein
LELGFGVLTVIFIVVFFPSFHVFYVFVHIFSFHFKSSHNMIYIYIYHSIHCHLDAWATWGHMYIILSSPYSNVLLLASYFLPILVWWKGGGRCWESLKHMWRWISLESIEWTLSKGNILPSIILISLSTMSPKSFCIKNHISCLGTIYKFFVLEYQTLN